MPNAWTYPDDVIDGAVEVLRAFRVDQVPIALAAINQRFGTSFDSHRLTRAMKRRGHGTMTSYMAPPFGASSAPPPPTRTPIPPPPPVARVSKPRSTILPPPAAGAAPAQGDAARRFARLLDVTQRGPISFADLCDRLDLSPKRARETIDAAQAQGLAIDVSHDVVAFRLPDPSLDVREVAVAPVTGARHVVGVISDTHLGSKYCLRAQLREFIHHAYERGARQILHPGDVLDGCYKHGTFELSHSGIEDQTRDLFETLPQLDGLTYHAITGNHDDTFADHVGMDPGGYVQNWFEARGRRDLKFYGRRGAYLRVGGAVVELWHPKKSPGYSLSYGLQNHIRDYGVGHKPDVLLVGHWHTWVYLEQRGVHALACGTFQANGSAFSKSLGGAPSIGGTLLSWELTEARTLRRFAVERSAYYEREDVREAVPA